MKNFVRNFIVLVIALGIFAPLSVNAEGLRGSSFALADQDRNTTLTPQEFRRFINILADAGHRNAQRVRALRLYKLAWNRVDSNRDGKATRQELSKTRMTHGSSAGTLKISTQ